MCGFLIYKTEKRLGNLKVEELKNSLSHRGIDISVHNEPGAFVIHNMLPMTNLVDYKQPLINPYKWKGMIGAFTGEIFNWKQIKEKYDLDCNNDSELFADIMYGQKSKEKVHEMDGFWNFGAIHNDNIIGVVDYLSQKPLYYRTDMEALCSEPYPLTMLGPVTKDNIFFSSIPKFGYDTEGNTPWNEIKQIPAGSYYENGKIHKYWNWNLVEDVPLRAGISRSVSARMGGERAPAILLSGGLDSAIIYHYAKKINPDIKVFHIENRENKYIQLLTKKYEKINLSDYTISTEEAIRRNQTPVDLGSVLPQAQLAEALKDKGIHVVLSGDGSDELFSGYDRNLYYDSQHSDIFQELPYYHNPRLDRIMMGSVVELRAPFMASYIVKYALSLDFEARRYKKILKELYKHALPTGIILREKLALKSEKIRKKKQRDNTIENIKIFEKLFSL